MVYEEITVEILKIVIIGMVSNAIKKGANIGKEKIKAVVAKDSEKENVENFKKIGRVRTILNPEEITNLRSIYYKGAVTLEGHNIVKSLTDFREKHVLVEGLPGQGKSLFMRYICIESINKRDAILPFFIELRRLNFQKDGSLKEKIIDQMNSYGFTFNAETFDAYCNSGSIALVLDGFDEIPSSETKRCAIELDEIAKKYKDLKIVVSSRPNSGMGGSSNFIKLKIVPLSEERQVSFIRHIGADSIYIDRIEKTIRSSKFLKEVANTPLLLTIYFILYRANQIEPTSISEFYQKLFHTLLFVHDRNKFAYDRERKSGLSDLQFEKIFKSLCAITIQKNSIVFDYSEYVNALNSSLKLERLDGKIDECLIVDDIEKITSLIIRDGFQQYSFCHKSIQEYFAACFIAGQPLENRTKFYEAMRHDYSIYSTYSNVLHFLSELDPRAFQRCFNLAIKKEIVAIVIEKNLFAKWSVNAFFQGSYFTVNGEGDSAVFSYQDGYCTSLLPELFHLITHRVDKIALDNCSHFVPYLIEKGMMKADDIESEDLYSYQLDILDFLEYLGVADSLADELSNDELVLKIHTDIMKEEELLIENSSILSVIIPGLQDE